MMADRKKMADGTLAGGLGNGGEFGVRQHPHERQHGQDYWPGRRARHILAPTCCTARSKDGRVARATSAYLC